MLDPAAARSAQDEHLILRLINDPILAHAEVEVFLPFLHAIALPRACRNDFDHDFRNPTSPNILVIDGGDL